ncbi:hypothetical protein SDC9_212491 [bioreactor metagenome]|uniref:Uncharacterized protein n=1 Tax=bioreactor metagenome TaxID=1076179 RepID=A0A645JM44_9ZZZZ
MIYAAETSAGLDAPDLRRVFHDAEQRGVAHGRGADRTKRRSFRRIGQIAADGTGPDPFLEFGQQESQRFQLLAVPGEKGHGHAFGASASDSRKGAQKLHEVFKHLWIRMVHRIGFLRVSRFRSGRGC